MTNPNQYLNKAIQLEIIKSQIDITLGKQELLTIVTEALAAEDNSAIRRVLQPFLSGKFPQFPDFTNVTLSEINEDGTANVTLKVPVVRASKSDETEQVESDTETPIDEPVEA